MGYFTYIVEKDGQPVVSQDYVPRASGFNLMTENIAVASANYDIALMTPATN